MAIINSNDYCGNAERAEIHFRKPSTSEEQAGFPTNQNYNFKAVEFGSVCIQFVDSKEPVKKYAKMYSAKNSWKFVYILAKE